MSTASVLFVGLIAASIVSSDIDFESEHVLTVCDAVTIWHTRRGEVIPECPLHLPPADRFFTSLKEKFYEKKCDNKTIAEINTSQTHWIERCVLIVKQLIDNLQYNLEQLVGLLLHAVEDISGLKSVVILWNSRIYSILVSCFFLFFHSQSKTRQWSINILLSILTSTVFYFVHLYYKNWFVTGMLIVVTLLLASPWYVKTWLPVLSALTFIHLMIPLLGLVLKLALEAQLLFGPVLYLVINGVAILFHIVCLIGLYIDEKLLIIKVIFLPFYQTFVSLFEQNERHTELIDSISRSVDDMTSELLSSSDFKEKSARQLDQMLTSRLGQLCVNATTSWYAACPVLFSRSCTSFVDQTEFSKIDKGMEIAGQWLTGLILPSLQGGSVQRTLSKQLCQQISISACRAVNLTEYCSPEETLYGKAYHTFQSAVDKLKESVMIQPWLQFNFSLFQSIPNVVHVQLDTDWIWIGRCVISFLLVGSALVLIFRALIQAGLFIRRYRTEFQFGSQKTVTLSYWKSIVGLKLSFKVAIFFLIEMATKWTHETLQKIQFTVPERGDARLAFNVQGNGTLASILRAVLGGFSVQSKYCTQADSSICTTPFFPVGWSTWMSLFSLAGLYFLIGLYRNKSDYFMCRLCDRFLHRFRHQRKEASRKISREQHQRRRLIILTLAEEALLRFQLEENKLILRFYRPPKRWFHRSFTPNIARSIIAHFKFKIDNLACQICFQNVATTRFRCKTLLFCDSCKTYLKRCPCGRDICQQGGKITIG